MSPPRFPANLILINREQPLVATWPEDRSGRQLRPVGQRDALCGVATRQALLNHLEMVGMLGPGAPLSFIVAKVQGLAALNQQFGWRTGDEALRAVALRTNELTRATDMVGRFTGSSFGVVLQGIGATAAGTLAARLTHHLNQLPELAGRASVVTAVATGMGLNADTLPLAAIDSLASCG